MAESNKTASPFSNPLSSLHGYRSTCVEYPTESLRIFNKGREKAWCLRTLSAEGGWRWPRPLAHGTSELVRVGPSHLGGTLAGGPDVKLLKTGGSVEHSPDNTRLWAAQATTSTQSEKTYLWPYEDSLGKR